jgi:hypothetical protein
MFVYSKVDDRDVEICCIYRYFKLLSVCWSVLEYVGDIYVVSAYIPIELGYRDWRCLHGTSTFEFDIG